MSLKKNRKPKIKKTEPSFILKRGNTFYIVSDIVISTLSADDAFRLGMAAMIEQRRQLIEDAYTGDRYINNIKIVDGLEATLKKLNEMFPMMREHINNIDLTQISSRIGRA